MMFAATTANCVRAAAVLPVACSVSHACYVFQLRHALQRQKSHFDNVNIDWNLSHDEGSTDFSDDETIIEDRVKYNPVKLHVVHWCSLNKE
jgi:hypothetical protein